MVYPAHTFHRIRLGAQTDVNYWTRELSVNERLLRHALACVGDDEVQVREFLSQHPVVLQL